MIVIAQDITAAKLAERALKRSEQLYRGVIESCADCIGIIDVEGRVQFINSPGLRALEIEDLAAVVGRPVEHGFPPESRAAWSKALRKAQEGKVAQLTCFCPTAAGTLKWWDIVLTPMYNEAGAVEQILSISRDITSQREASERLKWASEHDHLTSLPNRRAFDARLQVSVLRAMQSNERIGLLLLDLDHFKNLNDTLGHAAGDQLLVAVSKALQRASRSGDFVARLGGDEFAILIVGAKDIDLHERGSAILAHLRDEAHRSEAPFNMSASLGGAIFPDDATSAGDLLKHADIALYAAKESGRGGMCCFQPDMRAKVQVTASKLALARMALAYDEIVPYYQPKINLATNAVEGFEALLRYKSVGESVRLPGTISEAFNDYQLATRIADLMHARVLSDAQVWRKAGCAFGSISINAAPTEFLSDDFAERLIDRIQESGIPFSDIELEVTEQVFTERGLAYVGRALERLSDRGVRIALDDFGTGFSSLSHLRDFPVNVLKIDASFIQRIVADHEVRAIVSAVIGLCRRLGIVSVAEGIETGLQKRILLSEGCDLGQGFYFGPPIAASGVSKMLEEPPQ